MKAKTVDQLQAEMLVRLQAKKEEFIRMFREDVLGIVGIVGDADLAGNPTGKGKQYIMYGGGCSVSWMVGKGIKGKKYAQAAGGAMRKFQDAITPELIRMFPDKPVRPLMVQDITVNEFLQHQASLWFRESGVEVRTETRLD